MDEKIIIVTYTDDNDAYIFGNEKEAIESARDDLKSQCKLGTKAKIYDLTNVKHRSLTLEPVMRDENDK